MLDCDYDKIELILHQADGLGLLTDYHNYLVTSLDIDKINLDAYTMHNVNITGFRIVDPDSPAVQQYLKKFPNAGSGKENYLFSENALIHDAVRVYAKALNDLDSLQVQQEQRDRILQLKIFLMCRRWSCSPSAVIPAFLGRMEKR